MISRLLDHSSIIITEKVYAESYTINDEVKKKLSFNFTPSSGTQKA